MDREPEVRRVEHQVVLARLDRRRLELLARLLGGGDRVLAHVVGLAVVDHAVGRDDLAGGAAVEVFVAHAHRRRQAVARAELAAGLVDRGDRASAPRCGARPGRCRSRRCEAKYFCSLTRNRIELTKSAPALIAAALTPSSRSTLSLIGTSIAFLHDRRLPATPRRRPAVGASCTGAVCDLGVGLGDGGRLLARRRRRASRASGRWSRRSPRRRRRSRGCRCRWIRC